MSSGEFSQSIAETVDTSGYVEDIRAQPGALEALLEADAHHGQLPDLEQFDRVILTGMGASHFAGRDAWSRLIEGGAPAWWIPTDRLLDVASNLITEESLLVITSQSGRSGEIVELLDRKKSDRPALVIGLTNSSDSPLAIESDVVVEVHAGAENNVGTRSFVNSLCALHLVAVGLLRQADIRPEIEETVQQMRRLVDNRDQVVQHILDADAAMGMPHSLILVGRGPTITAALQGALLMKEAAKLHAEGMSAGEFRHGPLELADDHLAVVILEGAGDSPKLDRRLAAHLSALNVQTTWIGGGPVDGARFLRSPSWPGIGRPLAHVLMLQLSTVGLALRRGYEPGSFRNASKVTTLL